MKRFRWVDYRCEGGPLELRALLGGAWYTIWQVGNRVYWPLAWAALFFPSRARRTMSPAPLYFRRRK